MNKQKRIISTVAAFTVFCSSSILFAGCSSDKIETVTLRVCNWEEYIDLGDWDEDEAIDIENDYNDGNSIIGINSMVDDFTEWFNNNPAFDFKVKVEYSTFGTNEDLYNRLSLGDEYDLVCPSDYMLMKLIAQEDYVEFSDEFWNTDNPENYYALNVSGYIDGEATSIFTKYEWHKKAACYMWGTTGLVYNPEKINDTDDVSSWKILLNNDYKRQVTIKDNVRDAYFAALGIINSDELVSSIHTEDELSAILNDMDSNTVAKAEDVLKIIKENVYSFETDAGKSDMVTGKVIANYQWSGDAVYIMDEAEADKVNPVELWYSVPNECANLWFDGWLMLKSGISGNLQRKTAAEAFVNFLSRPDNAVRNMYYIGYTSAIAGDTIFNYMTENYEAEDDAEDTFLYDLSYFFGDESYVLCVDCENFEFDDAERTQINRGRQLFAQYPPQNVIQRSVIMLDFGDKLGEINQMWINVRCLDLLDIPLATVGIVGAAITTLVIAILLYSFRYRLFIRNKPKKGYEKSL